MVLNKSVLVQIARDSGWHRTLVHISVEDMHPEPVLSSRSLPRHFCVHTQFAAPRSGGTEQCHVNHVPSDTFRL